MEILAIVSPNGLGHLRRVVGIVSELVGRLPHLGVTLACEAWQLDRLRGWDRLEKTLEHGARTLEGLLAPGVTWKPHGGYTEAELFGWEERLAAHPALREATVVWSDNLASVLDLRPDAVLSGSFLWSDTLDEAHGEEPIVRRFVERERELLARHAPPMLCVEALATPGVRSSTDAVPVGWMCESAATPVTPSSPGARPEIALVAGASDASAHRRDELVEEFLARRDRYRIAAPIDRPGVRRFRFADADYRDADVVLCRPGAGALTQCVAHARPMLCLSEAGNVEMRHNAGRIERLGFGLDLGEDPPVETIFQQLDRLLEGERYVRAVERLRDAPRDGLPSAAKWLADRLVATDAGSREAS